MGGISESFESHCNTRPGCVPKFIPRGLGWRRDLPDARDYAPDHEQVAALLSALRRAAPRPPPAAVDLRGDNGGEYFTPVDDQGAVDSSPAFAVLGLIEYFERRSMGRTVDASRLFLYQTAREPARGKRDGGVGLRATLKALVRFGVPPEARWPYEPGRADAWPRDASLFGYARDYASIRYLRLDRRNCDGARTLSAVKSFLVAGFPVAFGFSVPGSLSLSADIPYRPGFDSVRGGQAVMAIGYDDNRLSSPRGALLVRSSWGEEWGEAGYGWLPYAYVEQQLAADFWTVLKDDWLQSNEYEQPALFDAPHPRANRP